MTDGLSPLARTQTFKNPKIKDGSIANFLLYQGMKTPERGGRAQYKGTAGQGASPYHRDMHLAQNNKNMSAPK